MPELALLNALDACGLQYTTQLKIDAIAPRRVDIAFESAHVAVFVDGCFWHGCPQHGSWPKQNAEFWRNKIERNMARDEDTNRRLIKAGWKVFRFWEHEDMTMAAQQITNEIR